MFLSVQSEERPQHLAAPTEVMMGPAPAALDRSGPVHLSAGWDGLWGWVGMLAVLGIVGYGYGFGNWRGAVFLALSLKLVGVDALMQLHHNIHTLRGEKIAGY